MIAGDQLPLVQPNRTTTTSPSDWRVPEDDLTAGLAPTERKTGGASVPDQMENDRPAVRARSVLEQEDALPDTQDRSAVRHRDG